MTLDDFILLHTTGTLNFSHWINVLYNPIGFNTETGNQEGRIEAISVTTTAFSVNGIQTNPETDISLILQQVENISLTFDNITYNLTVDSSNLYSGPNPYYIFQVTSDTVVPNINDTSLQSPQYNTSIIFNPLLSSVLFLNSDFNVIFNNGSINRTHPIKLIADREIGNVIPSNFPAILSTSASKADLQESFYTSTGITNARYTGTKTDSGDYAGVLPSFSARGFTGEIHPPDVNRDYACGLSNSDRILIPMLHTGPTTAPTFETGSTNLRTANNPLAVTDTNIQYTFVPSLAPNSLQEVAPGDLLVFNSGTSSEIMKVNINNKFTKVLNVTRKQLNTQATQLSSGTPIFKIVRTDLFRSDQFGRDISTVGESTVFVEENNILVNTDEFGTVFSSSLCPDPLLMGIDNPNVGGGSGG